MFSETGLSSTFESKLDPDDFVFFGGGLFLKQVSERFSYGLGIGYSYSFGQPLVIPFASLTHEGKKMMIEATIPQSVEAIWNYTSDFSYGLKINLGGSQFNLPDEPILNESQIEFVNFSRIELGPVMNYRIYGPLYASVFGGLATLRTFSFNAIDGSANQDLGLESGPFLSFKLSIRPDNE